MMFGGLQHPEIDWIERTGYPSWMQEDDEDDDDCGYDEDAAYEESRDIRCGIIREEYDD